MSLVLPKADLVICIKSAAAAAAGSSPSSTAAAVVSSPLRSGSSPLRISVPGGGGGPSDDSSSVLALCHPSQLRQVIERSGALRAAEGADTGFLRLLANLVLQDTPHGDSIWSPSSSSEPAHEQERQAQAQAVASRPGAQESDIDDSGSHKPPDITASPRDGLAALNRKAIGALKTSHSFDNRLSESLLVCCLIIAVELLSSL